MTADPSNAMRRLPSVDAVLNAPSVAKLIQEFGRVRVTHWSRAAINQLRAELRAGDRSAERDALLAAAADLVQQQADAASTCRIDHVINATGVVLHTNLGRAPLARRAIDAIQAAARYCNLEMDLEDGERSYRGRQIESLWRELTGAEAVLVVNNCASATLIALQALAAGREVIVSRGQQIEIGGSYRLPDVFRLSGAVLREVGTTNRTRLRDYEDAIGPDSAGILRVHTSNYRVLGFVEDVPIAPLVELARRKGLLAIDDLGSGCLVDLTPFGLPAEPTVQDSIAAGADLAIFSGDKLLGGPQCGVLLGRKQIIERIKKSPLARAIRVDKLTLAALQATLEIYLRGRALEEIPVLAQLTCPIETLREKSKTISAILSDCGLPVSSEDKDLADLGRRDVEASISISIGDDIAAVGGGSMPLAQLPTVVLCINPGRLGANALARKLRTGPPRVVPRIAAGHVVLDLRTVLPDEIDMLVSAIQAIGRG